MAGHARSGAACRSAAASPRPGPRRTAGPRSRGRSTGGGSGGSRPPAATRNCSATRSSPVVHSVTGCSTCSRVFISRKKNRPLVVGQELDGAGADVADRRRRRPRPPRSSRSRSPAMRSTSGDGASSMTFWCRRWIEHSRSPIAQTVPCASASTCTSMCRPAARYGSQNTAGSPNADAASDPAAVDRVGQVGQRAHDPHAAAAAAGRRLDQDRQVGFGDGAGVERRQHRHAGRGHQPLGLDLGAHRRDRGRRRADPGQPGGQHRARRSRRSRTGSRSRGGPRRRPPRRAASISRSARR